MNIWINLLQIKNKIGFNQSSYSKNIIFYLRFKINKITFEFVKNIFQKINDEFADDNVLI